MASSGDLEFIARGHRLAPERRAKRFLRAAVLLIALRGFAQRSGSASTIGREF
jgi:hypothetical protein